MIGYDPNEDRLWYKALQAAKAASSAIKARFERKVPVATIATASVIAIGATVAAFHLTPMGWADLQTQATKAVQQAAISRHILTYI